MPQRRLARTNTERDNAMTMALNKFNNTPPAQVPLSSATSDRLIAFQPIFHALIVALNLARFNQTLQTSVVAPLRLAARLWLNHGYQAMINACIRGQFPDQVKNLYGLPVNALGAPPMDKDVDLINAATTYDDGETGRVASGGAPISFPSQGDILANVNAFKSASDQQSALKGIYDAAQETIGGQTAEADQLILRIWNEVEAAFDTGDKPSMRRKARLWGVVYVPSPGEVLSPEEWSAMGTVLTAAGLPLEGAEATYEGTGITATSDADGLFYLPAVDPGTYPLRVVMAGYVPYMQPLVVTADAVAKVTITLMPDGPIPPMP